LTVRVEEVASQDPRAGQHEASSEPKLIQV
jgi:hypothetical protein